MSDWAPPTCRIRAVPHLAAEILTPDLKMVSDRPQVPFHRGLWLRMRRLLPPDYWYAWFTLPHAVRIKNVTNGLNNSASVGNYYNLIMRLQMLADALGGSGVSVTVGQATAWILTRPGVRPFRLAAGIVAWHQVDPTGQGWLPAAAGITPAEYAHLLSTGQPVPDTDTLVMLAVLRDVRLPDPAQVPVPAAAALA